MIVVPVNVDNFVCAETGRMLADVAHRVGGTGSWSHGKTLTAIDSQPIIRMNRDTLYCASTVEVGRRAVLSIPEMGARYVSVMIISEDHYFNRVFHAPGDHELTADAFGAKYVMATARILVDLENLQDVAEVNALSDRLKNSSTSTRPFELPPYDDASAAATRTALLELARRLSGLGQCFGRKQLVDPVRHFLGPAAGWGGLPEHEASCLDVTRGFPAGRYSLAIGEVPVDGVWSFSPCDADAYFPENPEGACSVHNITGVPNADGTIAVNRMPFPSWKGGTIPTGRTARAPRFLGDAGRSPGSHPANRRAGSNSRKGRNPMVLP